MEANIYKTKTRYKYIYYIIYVYYFLLAFLMVTPYYHVLNALSIVVSTVCLLHLHTLPKNQRSFYIVFYLIQFLILYINLFFIEYQDSAFSGFLSLFKNVITALLPAFFILDIDKLKKALYAVVLGGAINIVLNIKNGVASFGSGVRYLSEDMMLSLNSFGHASLIYFLCTVVLFFLVDSKRMKYALVVNGTLIILSLLITGSRQAFVSILAFFVFYQLFDLKKLTSKKLVMLVFGLILLITGVYIIFNYFPNSPIVRRFAEGSNEGDEDRLYFFELAWNLFVLQPFTGYGIDAFKYFSRFVYTHSTYSELIFTGGMFYSIFYFLYYGRFMTSAFSLTKAIEEEKMRKVYILILSFVLAMLTNGLFFLIHASRIALSVQFFLVNFVFSTGKLIRKEKRK